MKTFIITAYCDTKEKEASLIDTINRIKNYNGYDILLYSHYPVSFDIQKMCNYVLYDYSNPIFSHEDGIRAITNWTKLSTAPFKLNSNINDYGYAVIQQIKRGLLYMLDLGYDTSIVLNYDTKFSNEFLNEIEFYLNKNDAIFLDFSDGITPAYFLPFFAIKTNKYLEELNSISMENYIKDSIDLMAEGYMAKIIKNNIKVIQRKDWENKNKAWTDIIFINNFFNRGINDKFNFFIGLEKMIINNEEINFDKLSFLLYNINDDFNLKFEYYNDIIYSINIKKYNDYIYSNLPIPFSKLDVNNLNIFIDGIEIYDNYKNEIKSSSIEITKNTKTKKKNKIIDCILFNDEFKMLNLRLKELYDHIDYIIIVEGNKTHSLKDKPFYFNENKHVFEKYINKIIHVMIDDFPETDDPWTIEKFQRNSIIRGLNKLTLEDDDVVVISDCDEIFDINTVNIFNKQNKHDIMKLQQDLYFYNLEYKFPNKFELARICRYKKFKELKPQEMRDREFPILKKGGWHFSYFFEINEISNKIKSFAHQEFNNENYNNYVHIKYCIENGIYLYDKNIKLEKVKIEDNNYLPKNYKLLL